MVKNKSFLAEVFEKCISPGSGDPAKTENNDPVKAPDDPRGRDANLTAALQERRLLKSNRSFTFSL